jgi:hypothetical protein
MPEPDEAKLRELDTEIRALARTCSAAGEHVSAADVARLGLFLADLTLVLPNVEPAATHDYFVMVEGIARGALSAVSLRQEHDC